MIRWKYVIPRSIAATGLMLFLWFGVDPLIRWMLISSGQAITGARVDIEDVDASLTRGSIRLQNIAIADPHSTDKNLFIAREAWLDVETNSLLRRKLVIREGRLSGIRFNTERSESGQLAEADRDAFGHRMAEAGIQWMKQFGIALGQQLEDNSETVRVSQEMIRRWPVRCNDLVERAASIHARLNALRELVERGESQPLRDIESYRRALAELESLKIEYEQLRAAVEHLPAEAQHDRDALLAAKNNDLQRIRELSQLSQIDADTLSHYLLGAEQAERLQTVMQWIDWGRQLVPSATGGLQPQRSRGEDIVFADPRRMPKFLIRSLAIDGEGTVNGKPIQLTGEARGLSSEPKLLDEPTVVTLTVRGAADVQIKAIIDRTTTTPRDRFLVECPCWPQPERVLGRTDQLALIVPPSNLRLTLDVEVSQGQIHGQLTMSHDARGLRCSVGPRFGGQQLAARLTDVVSAIEQVDVVIGLAGPIARPTWTLNSDLGQQLAAGLDRALRNELVARRDEMIASFQNYADQQVAQFDEFFIAQRQDIAQRLSVNGGEFARLQQRVAARVGLPADLDRTGSQLRNLFRR